MGKFLVAERAGEEETEAAATTAAAASAMAARAEEAPKKMLKGGKSARCIQRSLGSGSVNGAHCFRRQ